MVGANGSGKSSVLQALHWVCQSGRNLEVDTKRSAEVGSTLSEKDATYMPSPSYRNAGHGVEYGNFKSASQLTLTVEAASSDGAQLSATMWIKAARNEGLSVHVPSNNAFVLALRNRDQEFSSYVPGLAVIPLAEERRSRLIVRRQAAAGDANTVLRNMLLLLEGVTHDRKDGLTWVQDFASEVLGGLTLQLSFDEDKNQTITASFQTDDMRAADPKRTKPLELAGIGFLQVIQIFSYLIYFRPVLLLVDEPDSHLHPTAQERLVRVLAKAAAMFDTQVVLTTHSPSVIRALPADAQVVWMKNGQVQPDGDQAGRQMMGWGLLDKRILLLSEDSKTEMLRSLLAQWPELERATAIWPLHGSGKLLDADGCRSLQTLFGDHLRIVLHRDRDFMMPAEAEELARPYAEKGIAVWLTRHSDVEGYWCAPEVIASHFGLTLDAAADLLATAVEAAGTDAELAKHRNAKRVEVRKKIRACDDGRIGAFNDAEVVAEYAQHGAQHVILGKTLCAKIRGEAQNRGLLGYQRFARELAPPTAGTVATDLRNLLQAQVA
ncbi:ATP-binding protein [Paracoccus sp. p3-h83]|uniref:ATP-binding protein n=1 Tax=Paracoccus sp. p3-h83 TaxID=3342805 RepID=UPI0035BAA775